MEKCVQNPNGRIELFEVANAAELKVAVKQFVTINLTRLIASKEPTETVAQNVTQLVNFVVEEAIDELLHSLKVIQAQNDRRNQTTH